MFVVPAHLSLFCSPLYVCVLLWQFEEDAAFTHMDSTDSHVNVSPSLHVALFKRFREVCFWNSCIRALGS